MQQEAAVSHICTMTCHFIHLLQQLSIRSAVPTYRDTSPPSTRISSRQSPFRPHTLHQAFLLGCPQNFASISEKWLSLRFADNYTLRGFITYWPPGTGVHDGAFQEPCEFTIFWFRGLQWLGLEKKGDRFPLPPHCINPSSSLRLSILYSTTI